jgi:MYXO-CTERM domain-containing protein
VKELPRALLATLALSGCAAVDDTAVDTGDSTGERALAPAGFEDRMRGIIKMAPPDLVMTESPTATTQAGRAAGTIMFMNRSGGTFTPGNEDARNNRSSIIEQTSSVAPWNPGDAAWNTIMTCVRAQFAPFDIDVTDVDPGTTPHVESVVAGRPGDIGLPDNVGGVSPFTVNCDVIPNPIVFTFAAALPNDPQLVCEIVAQEVSHSFGLDHEFLCEDPMTYLTDCGAKTFQNVSSACGEYEGRPCRIDGQFDCGTETQNSYAMLADRLGLRGDVPVPPALSILRPSDGETVGAGFTVMADASATGGAVEVELRIDGLAVATANTAPFEFTAPLDLELGTHVVELVATDGISETTQSIAVMLAGGDSDGDGVPDAPDDTDGDGEPDEGAAATGPVLGGCAASGGGSSGGAAALLVALVLAWRRRRSS